MSNHGTVPAHDITAAEKNGEKEQASFKLTIQK